MKYRHHTIISIFLFFACSIVGQSEKLPYIETKKYHIPKFQKRNQYYNEIRGLDGPNAPDNYTAYRAQAIKIQKKKFNSDNKNDSRSIGGEWEFDGPASFDEYNSIGRVNRIAFHPTDINRIYAATAGGGLWYTPNNGIDWNPLTDQIPNMNLSGVVVDSYDPQTLYILTGDGDGCCGGAKRYDLRKFSTGVLKSYDHGNTWQKTDLVFDERDQVNAYNLISHPINSGILFASTSVGLFKSSNGGVTFNNVLDSYVTEVAYKPDDSSIMYAVDQDNFYKSDNTGFTWSMTATIPKLAGEATRMTIATCENDPNRVYLYTAPRHDSLGIHRGLFLSDDAGETFTKVDSTSNLDGGRQGRYDLAVACSNADSDHVLIGKVQTYKSTDAGSNFAITSGFHVDNHQFITNPLVPERLYMATDGGIYYSDHFGDTNTWFYMSTDMAITQYYKISVGQTNPELVIGGSQDNGTHLNSTSSTQFTRVFGKDGMDCVIHPTNDNLIILSSQDGDFEFSDDMADTTYHLIDENDVPSSVQTAWVTPVAWDPVNPFNIYIGYEPIYTSSDGVTFNPISDTIGGNHFLHVGTANTSRLYASDSYDNEGTTEYQIHRSDDKGVEWEAIHQNMADSLVTRRKSGVTTNPDDSDEVWITLAGFDANNKVLRSIDAGVTWTNETGSLPNIPVNCIIYQDTNDSPSGAVYVGTDIGVYYRNDNLEDWIYFSNDLPPVEVADLDIKYATQTLYAGTHGRGIWTSDLYSECEPTYYLNHITLPQGKDYSFQASDSISLSNFTIEGLGASLKLKADRLVLITEEFLATSDEDNLFKASVGPCSGGVDSANEENEETGKN